MASLDPTQYVFDWSSRRDERIAMLSQLRLVPLAIVHTQGRLNGVIELLERLVIFARYLPDALDQSFTVDAQVIFLAVRIDRRKYVSERTIRRWTDWAKQMGVLDVRYNSKELGGHRWNTYVVNFARVMELIKNPGGHGRTRADTGGHDVRPQGRTRCPTLGADTMSDLTYSQDKEITNHSPAASSSEAPMLPDDCEREKVVVSALLGMGMSDAARAVRRARSRDLTFEAIDQLTERYRALQKTDSRVTIAWLHRWLTGRSRPEQARPPAPTRKITPSIDRAQFERDRAEAVAIAAVDEPLSVQLQRRREQMLGGASS